MIFYDCQFQSDTVKDIETYVTAFMALPSLLNLLESCFNTFLRFKTIKKVV